MSYKQESVIVDNKRAICFFIEQASVIIDNMKGIATITESQLTIVVKEQLIVEKWKLKGLNCFSLNHSLLEKLH